MTYPTPPPTSWVGKHETDGYEYIEYPIGSDIYWYRPIGDNNWQQWMSNAPQNIDAINNDVYSNQIIQNTNTQQLNNQHSISQQNVPSYATQLNASPPVQTGYVPSSNLNSILAPQHPIPLNYNAPTPASRPPNSVYNAPTPAGRPPNSVSFTTRKNNGGKVFRNVLLAVMIPIFLIGLSGILYVWASSLAGDSISGSSDPWSDDCADNDSDCDGVSDAYDNCVNDSNSNQDNFDGDGYGDVCDSDIDGDGITNYNDFHDYGDGKLTFEWDYARTDDGETYDGDGSGPDVYAEVKVDWDKDGTTDSTYETETTNNIKEWTNLGEITLNPTDSRSSIEVSVILWDDDYGEDDVLDYVSGTNNYYTYTIYLSESTYDVMESDGRDGNKGLNIRFIFDTFAD
jgi:hypothetical protein